MDEKTKEEMIGILQEFIASQSCAYEIDFSWREDVLMQVVMRYVSQGNKYQEGRYTEQQLNNFEKYLESKGIISEIKKFVSARVQTGKRIDEKLRAHLQQGNLDYGLCGDIKKDLNCECIKKLNDANIEYFEGLVGQEGITFDDYIEKARVQLEKITNIVVQEYNTRFGQILSSHLLRSPIKPLPPSKVGYPYRYSSSLKEETSELSSKYKDFIEGKSVTGNQEKLNVKIQYLYERSKMVGALHDQICDIQLRSVLDNPKTTKDIKKHNEKSIKATDKALSSMKRDYESAIAKLEKRAKKEERIAIKEQKAEKKAEEKRIKAEQRKAKKNQKLLPEGNTPIQQQESYAESIKTNGDGYLSYEQQVKNKVITDLGIPETLVNHPIIGSAIVKYLKDAGISTEKMAERLASGEITVQLIGNGCSIHSKYQNRSLDVVSGKDSVVIEEGYEQYGGNIYAGENENGIPVMRPGKYTYLRKTMKYDTRTNIEMSRKNTEYAVKVDHQVGEVIHSEEYIRDSNYLVYARESSTGDIIDLVDGPGDIATLDDVYLDDSIRKQMSMRHFSNLKLQLMCKRSEENAKKVECSLNGIKYTPLSDEELIKIIQEENRRNILRLKIEKSKFKDGLLKYPQFSDIIAKYNEEHSEK